MIRRILPAEAPLWRALSLEAIKSSPSAFTTTFEEEAALPMSFFEVEIEKKCVFVTENDDGLAVIEIQGDIGQLTSVYVRKTSRRNGLADALLCVVRAVAVEKHLSKLQLWVFEDNLAAVKLYEKHGFTINTRSLFGSRVDCCMVVNID